MKMQIIGISGISGAGKTTLTAALSQVFNATSLNWDEFDDLATCPDDYLAWFERGENYEEWDYISLAQTLHTLKSGKPVSHPVSGKLLQPTKYIIFDAPLGRLHQQTGAFIDVCIHIELPLDVSLARRIIRDFRSIDKSKEELLVELDFYVKHTRKLFFDEKLKKNADLVIDGLLSTMRQVKQISHYLQGFPSTRQKI